METRVTSDPTRFNPLQVEACRVALHRLSLHPPSYTTILPPPLLVEGFFKDSFPVTFIQAFAFLPGFVPDPRL